MQYEITRPDSSVSLVHYIDERGRWASKGRRVFFANASGEAWKEVSRFPFDRRLDGLAIARLPRRLLRSDKCAVHPTRAGKLLGIRGGGVFDLGASTNSGADEPVKPIFRIQGNCVMPRAIAEDAEGRLYFGEYFSNGERGPVRVWRVDPDLRTFDIAYEFPSGKARHVHAVHSDPYVAGRMWVTTGDFAGECHLVFTDDDFRSVSYLGEGGQLWRMVGVIFQEDRLCWLTDTHIEQNYVVTMDRVGCRAEIVAKRDASSWYAAETSDGLYLATTTVEPGPGIQTNKVRLLTSENGIDWNCAVEFAKDRYPMTGFGFGSISLPAGRFDRASIWLSGEGVVGLDGSVQLGRLTS